MHFGIWGGSWNQSPENTKELVLYCTDLSWMVLTGVSHFIDEAAVSWSLDRKHVEHGSLQWLEFDAGSRQSSAVAVTGVSTQGLTLWLGIIHDIWVLRRVPRAGILKEPNRRFCYSYKSAMEIIHCYLVLSLFIRQVNDRASPYSRGRELDSTYRWGEWLRICSHL